MYRALKNRSTELALFRPMTPSKEQHDQFAVPWKNSQDCKVGRIRKVKSQSWDGTLKDFSSVRGVCFVDPRTGAGVLGLSG